MLGPPRNRVNFSERRVETVQQAVNEIRATPPHSSVQLSLWREGRSRDIAFELGAMMLQEWRPLGMQQIRAPYIGLRASMPSLCHQLLPPFRLYAN